MDQPKIAYNPKSIFVVEGPAGAGKTQLTRFFENRTSIPVIRASLGAREFQALDATVKSAANDYAKLLTALVHSSSVVVIERFFLSQLVYGTLRGQQIPKHSIDKEIERTLKRAVQELSWRSGRTIEIDSVNLSWILVMPEAREIDRRRGQVDREFPWTAQQEYETYQACAAFLDHPKFYTDGSNLLGLMSLIGEKIKRDERMAGTPFTYSHI